jgi:hypothetical protein
MGHLRGERLRQRVVRGRGHRNWDRDRDSRTSGRGRGHDGVGIEKIHGVVLVVQQLVEHLSLIAFRRRLGSRREPVKVDETVIARWGDVRLGHGRGVVRERVLRRRDGDKGAKVRVRRFARTCGGWAFRGYEGRRGGRRGGREERRKSIQVRVAQRERGLRRLRGRRGPAWCGRENGVRGHVDGVDLQKRREQAWGVGHRETWGHAHVACNDTLSIDGCCSAVLAPSEPDDMARCLNARVGRAQRDRGLWVKSSIEAQPHHAELGRDDRDIVDAAGHMHTHRHDPHVDAAQRHFQVGIHDQCMQQRTHRGELGYIPELTKKPAPQGSTRVGDTTLPSRIRASRMPVSGAASPYHENPSIAGRNSSLWSRSLGCDATFENPWRPPHKAIWWGAAHV